jgi:hypothetical protein
MPGCLEIKGLTIVSEKLCYKLITLTQFSTSRITIHPYLLQDETHAAHQELGHHNMQDREFKVTRAKMMYFAHGCVSLDYACRPAIDHLEC